MNLTGMFSVFIGSNAAKRKILHPKLHLLIGGMIGIGGCYLSSYVPSNNFKLFQFAFTVTYGLGTGSTYMLHLYLAWQCFPGKEGVLSGVIIGGFGLGGFVFTYLSDYFVNPNEVDPNEDAEYPFPPEIADNLGLMLRKICLIWSAILFIAICLIQNSKNQVEVNESEGPKVLNQTEIDNSTAESRQTLIDL
jgi:MFS family permease